jgi:hypothetical protein
MTDMKCHQQNAMERIPRTRMIFAFGKFSGNGLLFVFSSMISGSID